MQITVASDLFFRKFGFIFEELLLFNFERQGELYTGY